MTEKYQSVYRGESPSKKLARLQSWLAVEDILGRWFHKCTNVVISSKEAGEVAVQLGLGVDPEHIIGIDVDRHAVAAARYKFPTVRFECIAFEDFLEAFPELADNLGCVFIDLCAPLRKETLRQVFEIGSYAKLLGYGFLCGREMGSLLKELPLANNKDPAVARLEYLQGRKHGRRSLYFNALQSWKYTSHSASHHGKTMVLTVGKLSHKRRVNLRITNADTDWVDIRERCLKEPKGADLLYNIRRPSLAAWKAHETRGTYRDQRRRR